ncbi:aminotransferase class III-fold pyridoxal phosphate-dependent enzyme [Neobacillus sp. PS3-40]|uniref:aminotransferase family protein n=1 Tax=Neobacillus sp. PS3-40 TaxID=3070679 RepID=UPI0027E1E4E4|nr:aminotransferase class III-fold pyridoxal phosphate-dependent enzyme [Neobacillus sp. PS3-40]WML46156.1 aminotransferase class III-fold pyridoxal phosphate-dependent enzyme [Neobacillus sp. PS3-40]
MSTGMTTMRDYPLIHPLNPINKGEEFVEIVEGNGIYIKDRMGRIYMDGISGLWNVSLGYNHPLINEYILRQLHKIPFVHLGEHQNETSTNLARKLLNLVPTHLNKVLYTCTGSESVELAIKIVRQFYSLSGYPLKKEIAVLDHSYHGTYFGGMSASGIDRELTKDYHPVVSGFHFLHTPYHQENENQIRNYENQVEAFFLNNHERLAAIILEPIVGSGGIIPIPASYLQKVQSLCEVYNVLLVFDEVATGFGRTGKMFAFEHFGITPDILCLSKGINSGYLPLGAVVISEEIFRTYVNSDTHIEHLSTQNGNPLACSAGLATLEVLMKDNFLENVKEKGTYFIERLKEVLHVLPIVSQVRGIGFMTGIELRSYGNEPISASSLNSVMSILKKRGLIAYPFYSPPLTCGLSLFPPLITEKKELDKMIYTLERTLRNFT